MYVVLEFFKEHHIAISLSFLVVPRSEATSVIAWLAHSTIQANDPLEKFTIHFISGYL